MNSSVDRRIIVVGSSNAGKSTLAERLARHLNASFIELDGLFWEPNWVGATPEVFRQRVCEAIQADSWVMAGNYSKQVDLSWPLADTIVWLDLPLHLLLRRCITRSWQRYRSRELLWGTNQEKFWEHLMIWSTDKSLLTYTLLHHREKRARYQTAMRDPRWSHLTFVRLRTPEEVEEWVDRTLQSAKP